MRLVQVLFLSIVIASCGVYSPYGAATSGASTFSVEYFETVHPLVSASTAITMSEALIDRVQNRNGKTADYLT